MKNIAVFASGNGTNTQKLIDHFKSSDLARVALIVTNSSKANVIQRAKLSNIPYLILERTNFYETTLLLDELNNRQIELIVLAGFLWLIPPYLNISFSKKIINIHPALLPKYGGKGMYGINVHKTIIANQENESGITIHYVNEHYDEGEIILQVKCVLDKTETPETLAHKIQELEHKHYPKVIEKLLR